MALLAALFLSPRAASARPDSKNSTDMYRYAANDMVKSFPSAGGAFRVHYTETALSPNAVPAGDANSNGVPDYVEEVAKLYDDVLAFYKKLGFRQPPDDKNTPGNNGGDERFDVYLLDFALKADGHYQRETCTADICSGYMVQENDFSGYNYPSPAIGNRILSSHEFFHAVQAGYDANQSSIISEGTAVWATEKFDSALDDFEGFLPDFFKRPDRSMDKPLPGAVDPFSYAMAIWFEFLDEHAGGGSGAIVRGLWEDCENGARGVDDPQWWSALPVLLARDFHTSFADEMTAFAKWNLFTRSYADPKRGYARGAGYPQVTVTFGTAPYRDDSFRLFYASSQYVRVAPQGREKMTAAVLLSPGQDASSLRVLLTTRSGNKVGEFVEVPAQPTGATPTVDTGGAEDFLVVTVNTAQSGDSLKGSLCVGSPDEVAPCIAAAPDMAMGADAATTAPPESGCSVGGRRPSSTGGALLFVLALLALGRKSRRLAGGAS